MTPRILVTQPVHDDVAERLARLGTLDMHPGPEPMSADQLARRLAGATAMVGFMTDVVDEAVLRNAPRLRIVAGALKGFDNYDVQACTRAGVWLSIVPDLLTEPTAELAVGLAIGLGRHVLAGDRVVREGHFRGWRPRLYGQGLAGSTVVVVGMGAVGRAIVQRLRGFGCRLVGVDPGVLMPEGVEAAALADALPRADLVMLALPLTADTRRLIGEAQIRATKPGALWVNVGRGGVVDESAMVRMLEALHVGGYAADVFDFEDWREPQRASEVPPALRRHPRTLFTPHLGSAVTAVRRAIEHRAVDNVQAVLRGQAPPDAVNRVAAQAA